MSTVSVACDPQNPWLARRARIQRITSETPGVATYDLVLDVPPQAGSFSFRPGQFNMLYLPGVGEVAISISGSAANHAVIPHTIRQAGNVTRALAELSPGATLGLRGPFGTSWPVEDCAGRDVLLIAGGIGITPLLSMARFLDKSSLPYELHYFTRTGESVAFRSELDVLHGAVHVHTGLARDAIQGTINQVLGPHQFANHVYICGPGAMLEMVQETAAGLGWPDEAVHFEYFQNDKAIDSSSAFDIELARSAMTLHVPAGKTILEVMREAGLTVPSSCEQGACGTCLTSVMEGDVDHQDVYLNKSEKASNTCMMTCVSRAKSARLVLDI